MEKELFRVIFLSFMIVGGFLAAVAFTSNEKGPEIISIAYAANCKIDDNLGETAQKFVGRCCKGSVKSVFPGNMWGNTVGDIKRNKSKSSDYKTAWKLISRSEYRK